MVCMIAQAWKPCNNGYYQINNRLPQVQSASSPQIPGTFHTTFESLIVFITTILALKCLIIRTEGVFLITLKVSTLQQLLLMFCGTTKINELRLELQNSLMLINKWVRSVVLCSAIQYSLKTFVHVCRFLINFHHIMYSMI